MQGYKTFKNEEVTQQVISLFLNGVDTETIGRNYNCHRVTIQRILRKNNISLKLAVNEKYFEKIDTEEKAYFLGFIFADGCIVERNKGTNYRVQLNLAEIDKDILFKFKESIGSEHKILFRSVKNQSGKRFPSCQISITNTIFAKHLMDKGCFPHKSLTAEFPLACLPDKLVRHFIRGYFDGDGSLYLTDKKKIMLKVLGSISFLTTLQKWLIECHSIKSGIYKTNSKIHVLHISGPHRLKFANILYNESTIYLSRKFNKLQSILEQIGNCGKEIICD